MNSSLRMISIVDDDVSVRRALGRLLRVAGYAVEAYESAQEFLDSSPGRTECLLLDIHLNGMNGFDVYDRLAADGATFPIILITAHDDASTRERARHLMIAAYLTKPVGRQTLLAAIASALRAHGAAPSGSTDPSPTA